MTLIPALEDPLPSYRFVVSLDARGALEKNAMLNFVSAFPLPIVAGMPRIGEERAPPAEFINICIPSTPVF